MKPSLLIRFAKLARRLRRQDRGQVLPVVALMLIALLGMAGAAIDLGRALICQRELQTSCDAAALATAEGLPFSASSSASAALSAATVTATRFSSLSGGLNQDGLSGVTMVSGYPQLRCLNTLKAQGMACSAPANANAVTVKQQMIMPTTFLKVIGRSSLTIAASSTASMRGSAATLYNVAIILDTTGSMNNTDADSNCNSSRIACAVQGVQVLLASLSPCGALTSSCGTVTNGNVANAVDRVSLFTFPGVTSSTAANEYNCSGRQPTVSAYSYPTLPTYQIVPFSSDYRSSDSTSNLATSSNLVKAAWGNSSCYGIEPLGGAGTYYAGVIYAAQAALVAAQTAGTKNVIILLSDGDASSTNMTSTNNGGVYPSVRRQCQQAVTAANAATAAGTTVYTVAYGATSSGCSTDTSGITPCQTMQQMATAPQDFFSDYTASQGNGACVSASQPTSNLNQIFSQIAGDLTTARLIPDNTT